MTTGLRLSSRQQEAALDIVERKLTLIVDQLQHFPLGHFADGSADVRDLAHLVHTVEELASHVLYLASIQHVHGGGHE